MTLQFAVESSGTYQLFIIKWFAPSRLGSFIKHGLWIWGDAIFLLSLVCSADFMGTLCSGSFSHHVKQVNFVVLFLWTRSPPCWSVFNFYSKEPKSDCFQFIHILSCRFNPIRSQLETVLDVWLVNACMKECVLIKWGYTFGLLAAMESTSGLTEPRTPGD